MVARISTSWVFVLPTLIALIFIVGPRAESMGYIPYGGAVTVGLSLETLSSSTIGPVTPLNSLLLDEHMLPLVSADGRPGYSSWEQNTSGRLRLKLSPGVMISREDDLKLYVDSIVDGLNTLSQRRWDARWALRYIEGMGSGGLTDNLEMVDEYTLDIFLKPDVDSTKALTALRSDALQFNFSDYTGSTEGPGPFIRSEPTSERHRFRSQYVYYAGRPYIDEFSVIAYPSAEESVLDFGRGSLDALLLTSGELSRYLDSSRADPERVAEVAKAVIILMFNPVQLPDPDERRALAMSISRESLAQVVLGDRASPAYDFTGTVTEDLSERGLEEDAHALWQSLSSPKERISVLVPDDPAARATAGRLRANIEGLGVPVDLIQDSGPLKLSMDADINIVSLRLLEGGEGVLPQCLALYDQSGWWNFVRLSLPADERSLLDSVRDLDPEASLTQLGNFLTDSSLVIPLVNYGVYFAPEPEIELVSDKVFPGTLFWRAYLGNAVPGIDFTETGMNE